MSTSARPERELPQIVGVSGAIHEVLRLVDSVAPSDCCVLIEGESGTGKELMARRLCAKSRRWNSPFIPVNCAGISQSLYDFQVGGYQVLNKWLKDRKGRELTWDDLTHYMKVAAALAHTMRIMAEIDEAIPEWPLQ